MDGWMDGLGGVEWCGDEEKEGKGEGGEEKRSMESCGILRVGT